MDNISVFINTDFNGCDFSQSKIHNSIFVNCDMTDVVFPTSLKDFTDTKFVNCKFNSTYISFDLKPTITPLYIAKYRTNNSIDIHQITPDYDVYASFDTKALSQQVNADEIEMFCKCNTNNQFYGYKILFSKQDQRHVLATLLIDRNTPSVIFNGGKCRAERVFVESIEDFNGKLYHEAYNCYCVNQVLYEVGEEVVADGWDSNPVSEYGHGIHFVLSKREAWEYCLNA